MKRSNTDPIGVFDSGIGGLTVFREIGELMPNENLVYLGDTARVPYGTKSPETVTRYSFENANFLLAQNVKAIVVACNTASAFAVPALKKAFDMPLLGVIEAGASEAMRRTASGLVGVIGTYATIQSGKYEKLLKENGAKEVISSACPLFVPLAEEGWTDNSIALEIAKVYLKPFKASKVDTLILGCTHYPLLQNIIASVCGPTIQLVNSARTAALELKETLLREKLATSGTAGGKRSYFVTDSAERAREVGGRFLGEDISDNLQLTNLQKAVQEAKNSTHQEKTLCYRK